MTVELGVKGIVFIFQGIMINNTEVAQFRTQSPFSLNVNGRTCPVQTVGQMSFEFYHGQ